MKKSIGSHISSRLRNLSKAELDAVAKQVLIILERAVVAGFISDDEKLYLELNKLCPTKAGNASENAPEAGNGRVQT